MNELSNPVEVGGPFTEQEILKGASMSFEVDENDVLSVTQFGSRRDTENDAVATVRGLAADQPIANNHFPEHEVPRNGVHSPGQSEVTPVESRERDLGDERKTSYPAFESNGYKYEGVENSNSSDVESVHEQEDLRHKSPHSVGDYFENKNIDITQRLPSSLGQFGTSFSAEEARLRLSLESSQIKERFHLNSALAEEAHRRFSLPADAHRPDIPALSSSHSSPPTSPDGNALNRSPYTPYKGQGQGTPRSLDRSFDDQDSYAFTANVKEGLYFCHLCSFSGTTQSDFDQHMTVHFEHVCPHCDYKSRTEGRLKRHIKDFHTEDSEGFGTRTMPGRPKIFRCKQCEYSTTDKVEFWAHSKTHIKEDKLLQCPRCPFVTEYKHHLEYHLRNHFGSKPFKCPKCNYACVNKSMLNSHMKSHTNVYQYRCADCTYATKYCHSLKLHLRKYNHKPAAVLNSDGSLPQGVDATASGLSLLAKRGPPRGPRGPRKDKLDGMPPGFPQMPPNMPPAMPGFPGMMSPFWPMLHGLPNGLPSPLGLGPRFNPQLPGLPGFGMKPEEMLSPPPLNSGSLKCNICSFVATNREVLTSHVLKVHAGENQDLFSIFGLSSESILEDRNRMNALNALKSPQKLSRMNLFGMGLDAPMHIKKEALEDVQKLPRSNGIDLSHDKPALPYMSSKFPGDRMPKDEGIDILKQMTLKFGSGPIEKESKPRGAGDSPLDLTKPRMSPPMPYSYPTSSSHDRKHEYDELEQSSGENSVHSGDITSPPPRKRSRKGKAFKLDTLCMKLQEQRSQAYGSDEDSNMENEEMYSSDLLPVEADDRSPNAEYDRESSEDDNRGKMEIEREGSQESDTKDIIVSEERDNKVIVDAALKEIHSSLAILNNNKNAKDFDIKKMSNTEDAMDEVREEPTSSQLEDSSEPLKERIPSPSQNRRKSIPSAIQRGADIAWKLLHRHEIRDPADILGNGNINHSNLELSTLDKKLWLNTEDCMSDLTKGEYECPHCKIAFGDIVMYTMHMGYHGYKDPYKCNMCGDTCKDRVEFFLHIARAAHN